MRKTMTIFGLAVLLSTGVSAAQSTYSIDTAHSNVGFKIRHLVAKVSGSFNEFDGKITADFENLDNSSVEFVIKTASIDTANEKRDGHLRSPDFFDAENHPEITFKSSKITRKDKDSFEVLMSEIEDATGVLWFALGQLPEGRYRVKVGLKGAKPIKTRGKLDLLFDVSVLDPE